MAAVQRVALETKETTWTVVDRSFQLVEPVESFLEYGRQLDYRPNTTRAYAQSLAQWWSFLEDTDTSWNAVKLSDFGDFVASLRQRNQFDSIRQIKPQRLRSNNTVRLRVQVAMSFYSYQAACGVEAAPFLWQQGQRTSGRYLGFLEHISRRTPQKRATVRIRTTTKSLPLLSPLTIDALQAAEAHYEASRGEWVGDLRYRLLWALLAETGMRIGEALSLQHRDWNTSRGTQTATISIVSRPHPHGLAAKSGEREIHVGSRLDRLYADYVWWLCDAGADAVMIDWDSSYIFCNVKKPPLFAPMRPESVYAHLDLMKRQDLDLPAEATPHWFRHTHATALLLTGTPVHVVSRRLGHANVQTTMNTYGHVTESAELEALANWRAYVEGWERPNA